MKLLLKASPRLLFFLIWLLPICIYILATPLLAIGYPDWPTMTLSNLLSITPALIVLLLWLWQATIATNELIPQKIRPHIKPFKWGYTYTIVWRIISISYMAVKWSQVELVSDSNLDWGINYSHIYPSKAVITLFLLGELATLIYMLYTFYFLSKNIAMAENQRKARFSEIFGPLLLCYILPHGIWLFQERLNQLHYPPDKLKQ